MNLGLHIALRYLFAKKSYHAINVISAISVVGVVITTMSLVVVLSVFNGFDDVIRKMYQGFDPDLKATLVRGKNFVPPEDIVAQIERDPDVEAVSRTLQEHVLVGHRDFQDIPLLKGVDQNYFRVTRLQKHIIDGSLTLGTDSEPFALLGQTVSANLQASYSSNYPLEIYLLKPGSGIPLDPSDFFRKTTLGIGGVFSVEEEANQYVLVPISVIHELLGKDSVADALEIQLVNGADPAGVKDRISSLLGPEFTVKDQYQQKELFYRIMKYEKWAGFMILVFILLVASFNVIGSLSMLILEKEKDMYTLRNMGAGNKLIRKIFMWEGTLISTAGALGGILLGVLLCWMQQEYGLLKLQGDGSFIITSYPVRLRGSDLGLILVAVATTSWFTTWYPVHRFFKRF